METEEIESKLREALDAILQIRMLAKHVNEEGTIIRIHERDALIQQEAFERQRREALISAIEAEEAALPRPRADCCRQCLQRFDKGKLPADKVRKRRRGKYTDLCTQCFRGFYKNSQAKHSAKPTHRWTPPCAISCRWSSARSR